MEQGSLSCRLVVADRQPGREPHPSRGPHRWGTSVRQNWGSSTERGQSVPSRVEGARSHRRRSSPTGNGPAGLVRVRPTVARCRQRGASESARMAMLAQMLRICGTTYWLLGQANDRPVGRKVHDTTTWRQHYRLTRLDIVERPTWASRRSTGAPRSRRLATPRASSKTPARGSSTASARFAGPTASSRAALSARSNSVPASSYLPGYVALDRDRLMA